MQGLGQVQPAQVEDAGGSQPQVTGAQVAAQQRGEELGAVVAEGVESQVEPLALEGRQLQAVRQALGPARAYLQPKGQRANSHVIAPPFSVSRGCLHLGVCDVSTSKLVLPTSENVSRVVKKTANRGGTRTHAHVNSVSAGSALARSGFDSGFDQS